LLSGFEIAGMAFRLLRRISKQVARALSAMCF